LSINEKFQHEIYKDSTMNFLNQDLLSVSRSKSVIEPVADVKEQKNERLFTEVFVWGCDKRG